MHVLLNKYQHQLSAFNNISIFRFLKLCKTKTQRFKSIIHNLELSKILLNFPEHIAFMVLLNPK